MRTAIVLVALLSLAVTPAAASSPPRELTPEEVGERLETLGIALRESLYLWDCRLRDLKPSDWEPDQLDPTKKVPDNQLRAYIYRLQDEARRLRALPAVSHVPTAGKATKPGR
jgi:hypothetical protein